MEDTTYNQLANEYRQELVRLEQESIKTFDKTVLTLSGGAFGLSLSFLKNVVNLTTALQTQWLITAWSFWVISLTLILLSFWLSAKAMRKTIRQLDEKKLSQERPGGFWDRTTSWFTFLGGLTFILGVVSMVYFIQYNLGGA